MTNLVKFFVSKNLQLTNNLLSNMTNYKGEMFGKFNLAQLKTPISNLTTLIKSFENLHEDSDRTFNDRVTRMRRYANFTCLKRKEGTDFIQNYKVEFKQNVPDERNKVRFFQPMERHVLEDFNVQTVFGRVTDMVWGMYPKAKKLEMSIHQVSIHVYPDLEGDNAPEGIHQDGADVIIPAMVFERSNDIEGGISQIYDFDAKEVINETIVEEGEFNMMQDAKLWHDITPFTLKKNSSKTYAKRSTLGMDYIVIE
jgi:hypothetical protein